MKKVLSILLVIAMAATLFAGCNSSSPTPSTDPTNNPTASAAPTSNEPTKDPKTSWRSPWKEGDELVAINIYDAECSRTQWNAATTLLLAEHGLKIGLTIAPVLDDQIEEGSYTLLKSSSGRTSYASAISNLFATKETAPDVLPALYALNTGANAVFKTTVGKKNLVDLAPFIEEGGILEDYVKFVWEDQNSTVDYFESAVEALKTEDGALYALPRLEFMPTRRLVFFNVNALNELNMEIPTTLDELETALAAWVNLGNNGFVFNPDYLTLESIITPIANMYGIDFDTSFDWKEMNGEPMFSYYYDEYLKVLQTVNKWAKNGWVLESEDVAGHIAMCTDLTDDTYFHTHESRPYKAAAALANNALALYGETWTGSNLKSKPRQWQDQPITVEGCTPALSGGTAFDYTYLAVSNRTVTSNTEEGYATVLKILEYINSTCNFDSYMQAAFGREGIPFADTWEESGCFVYVEKDGKQYIRFTDGNDRFDVRSEDETLPEWKRGKSFYYKLHPLYTWLFDKCNYFKQMDGEWRASYGFDKKAKHVELTKDEDGNYDFSVYDFTWEDWVTPKEEYGGLSEWQYYANKASAPEQWEDQVDEEGNTIKVNVGGHGITEFTYGNYTEGVTKYWCRDGRSGGMDWFADVSAFVMQYTIYYESESQYEEYNRMYAIRDQLGYDGTNTIIYDGFFPTPSEVLSGSEASDMEIRIESVKKIAKDFTIAYLSGTKGDSDWTAYLSSLKNAEIEEVYEFYKANAYVFNTKHKDGVRSMSDVIAERNKQ